MSKQTFLINILSGPGGGKSTACALVFAKLKILGYSVEWVPEVAKGLVWAENFDQLDNQYWLSHTQYKALKCLVGKVDFIITDGCLLHGIYYNRFNPHNVSDITKTEQYIHKCFDEFNNINIFLERGDFAYETEGRMQTEEQAKSIDKYFIDYLNKTGIAYEKHMVETIGNAYSVDKMIMYILGEKRSMQEESLR